MATVTIRNLPDEVHRAVRLQAAWHGRSTEAEIRLILEAAVKPEQRVKLGHIAAIAAAKGFTVATWDTSPFEAAGVSVINPWKHPLTPR